MNDRMAAPRFRRVTRRWAPRLALLAGSLAFCLISLEIGVRLFTDAMPGVVEKDPVVGQRFLKSFAGNLYDPEAERRVPVRFNSAGFRGPEWSRTKPAGVRRVALLGDSMIAALGVDEPRTAAVLLENLLNAASPDVRWEVLNFGVSGSSPGQELVLYREVVAQYEPDWVLCGFFARNDIADGCSRLSAHSHIRFDLDEQGELRQEPFSVSRVRVSQILNRYSRLYSWQRVQMARLRAQAYQGFGRLDPGLGAFDKEEPADYQHAWRIAAGVVAEFRQEVESRGGRFAVLALPSGHEVYPDALAEAARSIGVAPERFDAEQVERRLLDLCAEQQVDCCRLLPAFRAAAPRGTVHAPDEWLFLQGTGHFNEQGNALLARTVHQFLVEQDTRSASTGPAVADSRGRPELVP